MKACGFASFSAKCCGSVDVEVIAMSKALFCFLTIDERRERRLFAFGPSSPVDEIPKGTTMMPVPLLNSWYAFSFLISAFWTMLCPLFLTKSLFDSACVSAQVRSIPNFMILCWVLSPTRFISSFEAVLVGSMRVTIRSGTLCFPVPSPLPTCQSSAVTCAPLILQISF